MSVDLLHVLIAAFFLVIWFGIAIAMRPAGDRDLTVSLHDPDRRR